MARASMAYIITHLRLQINDKSSAVWDDDELQNYLDLYSGVIRRELLAPDVDRRQFASKRQMLEGTDPFDTDAGAAWDDDRNIIKLWNSSGSNATAVIPDEWNLVKGLFVFDAEQSTNIYLDGFAYYNMHGAIADAMDSLSMDAGKATSWTRGGVSYTFQNILDLADRHRSLAGPKSTQVQKTYRTERR